MVLTERALKIAGKRLAQPATPVLDKFSDSQLVASYASDSVSKLVYSGLITGGNNKISPRSNALRAEVAVLLYNVYNLK